MTNLRIVLILPLFFLLSLSLHAQKQASTSSNDLEQLSWKKVALRMPLEWYATEEAKQVAENVMLCQKEIGGWAKNKPYHHHFTEAEKQQFMATKSEVGATIDNGATTMEMIFLTNVYVNFKDERYRTAFIKALDYLFEAQYENGGWPQFYPFRTGKSVAYNKCITYNDNAMTNVLKMLRDIVYEKGNYPALQIDEERIQKAKVALDKGIECVLNTQIVVDGKPTVWCAQHDAVTLAPANARKYELASYSGAESEGIAEFLMTIKNPSEEMIYAVDCAVDWFEKHQLNGIKILVKKDSEGNYNKVVVNDPEAKPLWARFYDLNTEKPFFCDRDGIKKDALADIGAERRNGYGWYTTAPGYLLLKYPVWKEKVGGNN